MTLVPTGTEALYRLLSEAWVAHDGKLDGVFDAILANPDVVLRAMGGRDVSDRDDGPCKCHSHWRFPTSDQRQADE